MNMSEMLYELWSWFPDVMAATLFYNLLIIGPCIMLGAAFAAETRSGVLWLFTFVIPIAAFLFNAVIFFYDKPTFYNMLLGGWDLVLTLFLMEFLATIVVGFLFMDTGDAKPGKFSIGTAIIGGIAILLMLVVNFVYGFQTGTGKMAGLIKGTELHSEIAHLFPVELVSYIPPTEDGSPSGLVLASTGEVVDQELLFDLGSQRITTTEEAFDLANGAISSYDFDDWANLVESEQHEDYATLVATESGNQLVEVMRLDIDNFSGYHDNGGEITEIPVVDLINRTVTIMPTSMKYLPAARGGHDLGNYVYSEFVLKCGCSITNEHLELDDNQKPFFIWTIMESYAGPHMIPVGILVLDPATGDFERYEMTHEWGEDDFMHYTRAENFPTWVDWVFPMDWLQKVLEHWAYFRENTSLKFMRTDSKDNRDAFKEMDTRYTANQMQYQVFFTSLSNSDSISEMMIIDATKGTAWWISSGNGFQLGKLPENIKQFAETRVDQDTAIGINTCEDPEAILVRPPYIDWVCILNSHSGEDRNASFSGIAFVEGVDAGPQLVYWRSRANDMEEAFQEFKLALQRSGNGEVQVLDGSNGVEVLTGSVIAVGQYPINTETEQLLYFVVIGPDTINYHFRIDASEPAASFIEEGDEVTVTYSPSDIERYLMARSISSPSFPLPADPLDPAASN